MRQLKISIIDPDENARILYKSYCNKSSTLSCILAVRSLKQFISYYQATEIPDIILLDLEVDTQDSAAFEKSIVKIKTILPEAQLILFTKVKDENTVIRSFKAGADGYLLKSLSESELNKYLIATQLGGAAISPKIARLLIQYLNYEKVFTADDNWELLSRKQIDIVDYMAKGLNASEIALQLNLTVDGVNYHIRNIYKKLKVKNKADLLKKYFSISLN